MSATRTILLGAALGLAAGAMTLAQDTQTPPATLASSAQTAEATDPPAASILIPRMDALAPNVTRTPLPQGPALVAAADDLIGARVFDSNQEWVGEVSAFRPAPSAVDPRVVIDIGGFLGFGETPVAVDADAITVAWSESGKVVYATVDATEAELETLAQNQS